MKKILLTGLAALLISTSAFAEDTVSFSAAPRPTSQPPSTVCVDKEDCAQPQQKKTYFTLQSITSEDEQKLLNWLAKRPKHEDTSYQALIENGHLHNITYDLSYENNTGASVLKAFKTSELYVNIEACKGQFQINTVKPDYFFTLDRYLTEELNGKKYIYDVNDSGYVLLAGKGIPASKSVSNRKNIDVICRVSELYSNFKVFLGTATYVELPLLVDKEERTIPITITKLNDHWYNLSTGTLADGTDPDIVRVQEVHVLLYTPSNSQIGIPYECDIITNQGSLKTKLETK